MQPKWYEREDVPQEFPGNAEKSNFTPLSLEEGEKILIQKTLDHTNHHYTKASELLGISRVGLYRKMKKYGFETKREKKNAD